MPIGVAGAVALGGAAIGAGASIYGASQQSNAINSSSKSAARAQEEARIIAQQDLTNVRNVMGPRLETAGGNANTAVTGANDLSRAYLSNGAIAAGQALGTADAAARAYLNDGRQTIGTGVTNANALLQPYMDVGGRALGVAGDLSGANGVDAGRAAMANFQASPAYDFNMSQGLRAIDAGASAKGMLVSGGTRRAEQQFGAGLASNEFQNYYQRLSGLAGQGLNASNAAGGNMMAGAQRQSGFDTALASNALGTGTAMANLHSGLGTALSNNEMATGGRLAANEQWTGGAISNLYTGNATTQANIGVNTAANQAQTLTSAGSSLASIYGGQSQGVGNAINSGMNNYTYLQERQNPLAPQNTGYSAGTTSYWNPAVPAGAQQYMTAR